MDPVSVAYFREAYPEFTVERFPDGQVDLRLHQAGLRLPEERWGEMWTEGVCLYAAHHLTMQRAATLAKDGTGGLDVAAGPVVSKSKAVGGVSKSESRAGAAANGNVGAGHWNSTIYGQQLWQLMQLVGAGGLQV